MHNSEPSIAGALAAVGMAAWLSHCRTALATFFFNLPVLNMFFLILLFGVIQVVEAVQSIPRTHPLIAVLILNNSSFLQADPYSMALEGHHPG